LSVAWLSLALCLGGMLPFVWFVTHADWGQGGELQGVGLVIGTVMWASVWAVSSLIGLVLSVIAWRRSRSFGIARLALAVNGLSLAAFLIFVVMNFVRAAAVQSRW
jgi:hypothetical protein